MRTELGSPLDDPLRGPGAVLPVGLGSVRVGGDVRSHRPVAAHVAGDAPAVEDHLDRRDRRPDPSLLADQRMGGAVVPMLELDVVVDVDLCLLPRRWLEAPWRKGGHCRLVDGLEHGAPAAIELAERVVVELFEELGDRPVEVLEREERDVAELGEDPALNEQDAVLDLRLVTRPSGPGGNNGDSVVLGELGEHGVDLGVDAMRTRDRATQLIGDEDLRDAAEVLERANRRSDELVALLGSSRLREREVARAEHGDVQLDLDHLAGLPIDDLRLRPRVIDEALLAGAMLLPHHCVDSLGELPVALAELAVLVGASLPLVVTGRVAVLGPQQLERDALLAQLSVHPLEIDRHAVDGKVATGRAEELLLELAIGELARDLPGHTGFPRAPEVVADRPLRQPGGGRNLAVRSLQLELESENFSNASHLVALHSATMSPVAAPLTWSSGP